MRNRAFLKVALLGLLTLALAPGYALAAGQGQDLSEMLASSAAVHATAVSGPILSGTPLSHDYGVQDNGTSTAFFFQFTNIGDQDLHITSISTSDPAAFTAPAGGATLVPGAMLNAGIVFHPTDGAHHDAILSVMSDGGNLAIPLSGQGNAPPTIVQPADVNASAFTTVSFTVMGSDNDDTLDDALTFSMVSNLPPGPTFDTATGAFLWHPIDTDGGTFTATFSVTDGRLSVSTAPVTIHIVVGNRPPVANAGGSYNGATNVPLTLDGSASFDPDAGQVLSYHWDFGDGSSGSGATPSHTYTAPNTYIAILTVCDDLAPPDQLCAQDFASVVIKNEVPATLILKNNGSTIRTHGGGKEKVGIEEVQQPLTSILIETIKMKTTYPNAGTVSSIAAQTKGATIGDMDLDGFPDLDVYFTRTDLNALLSNVPNNTVVTIDVTGDVQTSTGTLPVHGTKLVTVKSSGNAVDVAAYPNPFNPQTNIAYTTRVSGTVTMHIYSIDGRLVRTLKQGEYTDAGTHEVTWNGVDNLGRRVPSGVYFVKTTVGSDTSVFKLAIMK
jgi:PKD domain-containing protein/putative Ig domain-containing protein/flagellar hook capping protein FlgD/HYDIN/CFA65/VesB family protein